MKTLKDAKFVSWLFLAAISLLPAPAGGAAQARSGSSGADKWPQGVGHGDPAVYRHYKALEAGGFAVEEAWKMGITGKGVNVAISDGGIDFGTPDLNGAQARVTAKDSPYYGWPIVIDLYSTTAWQETGAASEEFIDTSSTDTTGCKVTGTSKSGVYHIGVHPERRLKSFWGKDVKVLVVDEKKSGVYDTVYMDLNCDRDFTNDKPCRKGDEVATWDRDGDGLADESGGMIYFISDGVLPVPLGRLLYGAKARVPKNGALLAVHFDMNSHGTMCAGTIAGRGRIIKGLAPGASLIPVLAFPDDIGMLLAVLGYDGKPGTGDDADIVSRSAGFPYGQKGADELSAFLEYLTTKVAPRVTLVFAASNEGSGYATVTSPSAPHIITGGAIEDLWFKNSPNRGDVASFSARGPNVVGFPKPTVLGTGAYTPRVRPLANVHSGAAAFDMGGGGTSNGCPHVAGVAALICQAYKQAHGVFPTSEEVRDILMSSADDINDEPFAQGAGMINGYRAAMLALGKDGVLARPAVVSPGQPIAAGSEYDARITLKSFGGREGIQAVPQHLVRTGRWIVRVPAARVGELVRLPNDLLNCDLLRISSYVPPEGHRDRTLDDTARFGYWLSAYDWNDTNHDGSFGPAGAAGGGTGGSGGMSGVTLKTAQKGEAVILANTDWGGGGTSEVRVHDPRIRVRDGLLLGLAHTTMDPGREVEADACVQEDADVVIVAESFCWMPWDAVKVVLRGGELWCGIKAPDNTGIYEGRILATSKGNGGRYRQSIPVGFSTYRDDGGVRLAGTNEIYENDHVYARIEGSGRDGYRDDRIFAVRSRGAGLIAIKASWEDPLTELDLALYAPGTVDTAKAWSYPAAAPIKFPVLPVMKEVGRTPRRFQTGHRLSGGTDKTLLANAGDGVNILVVNSTNNSRNRYGENIAVAVEPVGVAVPERTDIAAAAGKTMEFRTTADAVVGFGRAMDIKPSEEAFRFEARKGDRLFVRFGPMGEAELICDTNGDGRADEDKDEVILRDEHWGTMEPDRGMVVALPYDGTYFLRDFYGGTAALLDRRLAADKDGRVTVEAPTRAGTYYGASEVRGEMAPGNIVLEVRAAEAARVEIKAADGIVRGKPFAVDLKAVDIYGNAAGADMDAVVTIEGAEARTAIKAGAGRCEICAPDVTGSYSLVVRTALGLDRIKVNVVKDAGTATDKKGTGAGGNADADAGAGAAAPAAAATSKGADKSAGKGAADKAGAPGRVEGLKLASEKDGIRLTWKAPEGAAVDHYVIYRVVAGKLAKLGESRETQYLIKADPWNSYTVRVAAASQDGTEGEPGDIAALVFNPFDL